MAWLRFVYFEFNGRIDRGTWWLAWALLLAAEVFANHILSTLMNNNAPILDGTWPNLVRILGDASGWIIAAIFFVPNAAMNAKRFHDRDLSGWWWFLFVFAFVLSTIISVWPSYGGIDYPSSLAAHLLMFSGLIALWMIFTLGFLPSKPAASNRYLSA